MTLLRTDPGVSELTGTRLDAVDKVTGKYMYGMDVALPGMLHGAIVRSTHPHARLVSIDTRRALSLPGVATVITGEDLPDVMLPGAVHDQPPLARRRVRYVGEPVALIAATRPDIAIEAAGLVEVTYDPLPVLADPEAALRPEAVLLHEDWASYRATAGLVRQGNVCCHASLVVGDISRGFGEASQVVEERFATRSVHQAHIEPRVAVASASPSGDITIYASTQVPFGVRSTVATVLGIPEARITVIPTGIGGGFGSKLHALIEPLAALLARRTGRPVRLVMSFDEDLIAGAPRHPCTIDLRTGVAEDGRLTARQARLVYDAGAYAGVGPEIASLGLLVMAGPYQTPHLRIDAYAVYTNKTSFGSYRAPGAPQAVFALESHLDTVAARLGMDPLQFRLKNALAEGDTAANGQRLEGVALRECLHRAADAIGWEKPSPSHRGKGIACGWWTTAGGPSGCMAKLEVGGKVTVVVGTPEIGTGAIMGGVAHVVAQALGVATEDVHVVVGDTAYAPWDFGSHGSRTLFNVGRAAEAALADLVRQIMELAADILEAPVDDLELAKGMVGVRGVPQRSLTLAQLAQEGLARRGGLIARGVSNPGPPPYDRSRMSSCLIPVFHRPSFHCHAAEVEVDPETGEVRILRYVAAHDVGVAMNPDLVEAQVHGGVVQGIGMALTEEIAYEDGYAVGASAAGYKIPACEGIPDLQVVIVEQSGRTGLSEVKGIGEPPVIYPPAALANAIYRATGARVRALPISPPKILAAADPDHIQGKG